MSVSITSNPVQLDANGKITLKGTGISGQVIRIFFTDAVLAVATVASDGTWATPPFTPPAGAGTYTVTARVQSMPSKMDTEDIQVTPAGGFQLTVSAASV